MPADSPRRFRLPGPFVWSQPSERIHVTHLHTPEHDTAGFKLMVEVGRHGDFIAHGTHRKLGGFGAETDDCASVDDAKAAIEAEVARVAASMMVEVPDQLVLMRRMTEAIESAVHVLNASNVEPEEG